MTTVKYLDTDGLAYYHDKISSMTKEDLFSYGVEWESGSTSPVCTRIGNLLFHATLPVQSQYKGCIYDTESNTFKYWLDENDWTRKADGTTSILDGTDGQICVHIPTFYGKSGTYTKDGKTMLWVRISPFKIDNTWTKVPELYVGANKMTINKQNMKAASVVNESAEYRGGGDRSNYDQYTDKFRTDLNKPRTNITRELARIYARNAGTELLCYDHYKWIFYWNYVIEYANFDSLAAYNASLTSEGYHQGGLGDGVTTWSNTNTTWSGYNATYPLTPNGYGNSLGNGTGRISMTIPTTGSVASKTFLVPRWRGFDNPFGDVWTNLDGVYVQNVTSGTRPMYATDDPKYFGEDTTSLANMRKIGDAIADFGTATRYVVEWSIGTTGELVPKSVNSSINNSGKKDRWYTGSTGTDKRLLLVGGNAYDGAYAGLGSLHSNVGLSLAYSTVGFRFSKVVG